MVVSIIVIAAIFILKKNGLLFLHKYTQLGIKKEDVVWVQMKHKYYATHLKQNKCMRQNIFSHTMENMKKCLFWVVFGPPTPGK
jgi:hypothetical protein